MCVSPLPGFLMRKVAGPEGNLHHDSVFPSLPPFQQSSLGRRRDASPNGNRKRGGEGLEKEGRVFPFFHKTSFTMRRGEGGIAGVGGT